MARFPKIDSPCPLSIDAQKRIDGYCNQCSKHVHALDTLDDCGRAAFMAAQRGPVCVSYRMAAPRAAVFGVAMAATLMASAAQASEGVVALADAHPDAATQSLASETNDEKLEYIVVVGGTVTNPADTEWVDDSDLPELPVVVERAPDAASSAIALSDPKPRR